ncbi:hypothetical protein E6P78_29240 [Streptomyces sp. A0958]|nr:hypothetical protein E6P78_29240 [Streptomyces sp. A0958]
MSIVQGGQSETRSLPSEILPGEGGSVRWAATGNPLAETGLVGVNSGTAFALALGLASCVCGAPGPPSTPTATGRTARSR